MADVETVAVLRIELEGIEPLTWRRVAVRTAMSLTDVHQVVQAAMGWLDCHLWYFEADGRRFSMRVQSEPEWNERYEDAGRTTLAKLLDGEVRRLEYVYDMGDFWEHSVIVEKSATPLSGVSFPQFLGGERRCPPEDCGGPHGYYEFLKNISSKRRQTRDDALRWYNGAYDPNDIDQRKVITALRGIARDRAKP